VRAPLFFALAGAALAGAGCNSYASVPEHPAYDLEVRPLLMAHCGRCHGAGGNLNVAREPTGPDAAVLPSIADTVAGGGFVLPYVTRFDTDTGAGLYAGRISDTTHEAADGVKAMPPPPASRLDDWALGVLANWAKNPICSNSPNPDTTLCPGGPGKYVP
jgi:hypothetical protein